MKVYIIILVILFSICSCEKFIEWDLNNRRTTYSGEELRTDGYYYCNLNLKYGDYIDIFFLNRNGTILYANTIKEENIIDKEERFESGEFYNDYASNERSCWGIFFIEPYEISFEKWEEEQNGGYHIYLYKGDIINDTTFRILERYRYKKGREEEYESRNMTYHFKKFANKPDSTCSYIE